MEDHQVAVSKIDRVHLASSAFVLPGPPHRPIGRMHLIAEQRNEATGFLLPLQMLFDHSRETLYGRHFTDLGSRLEASG